MSMNQIPRGKLELFITDDGQVGAKSEGNLTVNDLFIMLGMAQAMVMQQAMKLLPRPVEAAPANFFNRMQFPFPR